MLVWQSNALSVTGKNTSEPILKTSSKRARATLTETLQFGRNCFNAAPCRQLGVLLVWLVGGDVERFHLLDLFYQVRFLVVKLVVLRTVVVEPRQKLDQLVSIT